MTKSELLKRLQNEGIPEESYSLDGGLFNERLCLEYLENRWYVYYCEKGIKTNVKDFFVEDVACQYFYNEIVRLVK
jgi:hypothetical protein